jgi:hypothetical protein
VFPVANTDMFDLLSLLTDPGATYQPRWMALSEGERRAAADLAAEGARFRAVGAVLMGHGDPSFARQLEAALLDLDTVSGARTLVVSPTPAVSKRDSPFHDRPYMKAYETLRSPLRGLARTDQTADRFDRAFRLALGLKDSADPGIVAAPNFASSAFAWIPLDPYQLTTALERVRDVGERGLFACDGLVRTVPLGVSVGEALRGVLAQGLRREVIGSAKNYPNIPQATEEILRDAQAAIDRAAAAIDRMLRRMQPAADPDTTDQLWETIEWLLALRVLDRNPSKSRRLVCREEADRTGLHPIARASLEGCEALVKDNNLRPMPWPTSGQSAEMVNDYALAVVGLARCVEVELNQSLLQWRRKVRDIRMPEYFMRYEAGKGPVTEFHPDRPKRSFDINRPRHPHGDDLLAPSVSQLMSIGGTLCDPPPSVGAPGCDDADWRRIRQACSRLTDLRNRAAHDQPIDRAAWNQALEIARELDGVGAWRAFRELRDGLRR